MVMWFSLSPNQPEYPVSSPFFITNFIGLAFVTTKLRFCGGMIGDPGLQTEQGPVVVPQDAVPVASSELPDFVSLRFLGNVG